MTRNFLSGFINGDLSSIRFNIAARQVLTLRRRIMLSPIRIGNRINGFLGKPAGSGKRPAVIHLHERYGIVQHTTDLGQKFVDASYVTIVLDLFSRFTGDRQKLAAGDDRCELDDGQVLADTDAVVAYLRTVPQADTSKVAMSGVCQTGRQP